MPIHKYILQNVKKYPNREAIIYGDRRLTYKELNERANRLANGLIREGIKKGDHVAVMLRNCNNIAELYLALWKIGAAPATVNYRYVGKEIQYIINHSDANAFVMGEEFLERIDPIRNELTKVSTYISVESIHPEDKCQHPEYMLEFEDLIQNNDDIEPNVEVLDNDLAILMYTGGTTGMPKGALQTHLQRQAALTNAVSGLITALGLGNWSGPLPNIDLLVKAASSIKTKWLLPVPVIHESGSAATILSMLMGGTVIYPANKSFTPKEIFELIEREKCNSIIVTSTSAKDLLSFPEINKYDTRPIKILVASMSLWPIDLKKAWHHAFPNAAILDQWGLTEIHSITTYPSTVEDLNSLKPGCIGKPFGHTNVRVINESGDDVKPGESGELIFSAGDAVIKGYYKDPEKTSQMIKDGWFYSGDIGTVDEEGNFYIMGDRIKECIFSGAEKIYPKEVEEVIITHPKVKDVAVLGIPDDRWGESVLALVQLEDGQISTEQEIIQYCKDNMASYKKPRFVEFVDESVIKRTDTGKRLKAKLKDQYFDIIKKRSGKIVT